MMDKLIQHEQALERDFINLQKEYEELSSKLNAISNNILKISGAIASINILKNELAEENEDE